MSIPEHQTQTTLDVCGRKSRHCCRPYSTRNGRSYEILLYCAAALAVFSRTNVNSGVSAFPVSAASTVSAVPPSQSLFQDSNRRTAVTTLSAATSAVSVAQEGVVEDVARAQGFLKSLEYAWNTKTAQEIVEECFVATPTIDGLLDTADDGDDPMSVSFSASPLAAPPFWRDMVAFTWNICTTEGSTPIQEALEATLLLGSAAGRKEHDRPVTRWSLSSTPIPIQRSSDGSELEFWCDISIDGVGSGKAHIRLQLSEHTASDKMLTLLTTLMELEERPFQVGAKRVRGHIHGPTPKRKYWQERLEDNRPNLQSSSSSLSSFVVIVGGGQAGLTLGARLQYMAIPYIILEAGARPGVAWRTRYPSLHLHDPVWYNHMPYLPFPETWPILCPRDKIADWMESYANILDLNVQTHSRVTKVIRPADSSKQWELQIQEGSQLSSSEPFRKTTLTAQHVVFATGNSSKPRIPTIPGNFAGLQLHSSHYHGGRPFANQRVVVIGSNNSGLDIVQDLWEQGAKDVTMVQRSPSMIVSTDSVLTHGLGRLYREDAPLHHEDADLVATATPYKLMFPRWKAVTKTMQKNDRALLKGLELAGYQMEEGLDGTGIFAKSATEGGGFYINMGCAELLVDRDVAVRYATVSRLERNHVVVQDKITMEEEALPADVIVYATGFDTMDQWVAELCGDDLAKEVGKIWGIGLGKNRKDPGPWEGELRNMWKPTTVEGLWFHGGNLAQSRHYSRLLALQLAARYIGLDTPVHGIPEPTQLAHYNDQ